MDLAIRAKIAGLAQDEFQELLATAARTCPVSKALGGTSIRYEGTLDG